MSQPVAPDRLRAAILQPEVADPADLEATTSQALAAAAAAAERGAELLLMPEVFPGPMRPDARGEDPEPRLAAAAREAGIALCWSRLERRDERIHVVVYLFDREGERVLRYVRAHPATGDVHPVLHGARVAPGPELGLARLGPLTVGIAVCSELWLPEVSRILALRGAELILAPAGGGFAEVAENWRLITRARAIENNCFVLMTHSRLEGEAAHGLIAGPEELVADGRDGGSLVDGELDLARGRWLRAHDDSMAKPKPFRSLPGLLRAGRPELYGELSASRAGAYPYGE